MSDTSSPRLVCRAARTWSAWFQSDRELEPASLWKGHVAQCPDCQAYFEACGELDDALRAEAQSLRVTRPGLEERVIQAVGRSQAPLRKRAPQRSWGLGLAGLAAAGLAVTWVASDARRFRSGDPEAADVARDSRAVMESVTAMGAASRQWWNTVAPSAAEFADRDPLQGELRSVVSDAQSAASFLAKNFLPDTGLAPDAPTPQPQQG